jgi:hypothetical protein
MRTHVIRAEVHRLLRQVPFRPFLITMESGDSVPIEHPENIAFEPGNGNAESGSRDFYVLTRQLRVYSTFDAVTSVSLLDEPPAEH